MSYKASFKGNILKLPKQPPKPMRKIEIGNTVEVETKSSSPNGYYKQLTFLVKNGGDITVENYLKKVESKILDSLTLSCTITAFHVSTLSVQSRVLTSLPYPYSHGFSRIYRIRTITAFHVSHFQR